MSCRHSFENQCNLCLLNLKMPLTLAHSQLNFVSHYYQYFCKYVRTAFFYLHNENKGIKNDDFDIFFCTSGNLNLLLCYFGHFPLIPKLCRYYCSFHNYMQLLLVIAFFTYLHVCLSGFAYVQKTSKTQLAVRMVMIFVMK